MMAKTHEIQQLCIYGILKTCNSTEQYSVSVSDIHPVVVVLIVPKI